MPWLRGTVWYTRFRFEGKQICRPTKCKTEEECRAYEIHLKKKLERGEELAERKGPLLSDLGRRYVDWLLSHPDKSDESAIRAAGALLTILKRLNSYGVRYSYQLKPEHIERYRNERLQDKPQTGRNKTITPRTVDIEVSQLKFAFNRGLKQGWVHRNPIQHVEMLKAGPKRIISPLRPQLIRDLLSAATDTWRPIFYFFLTTGCRKSEGCLLEWHGIDFARKCARLCGKDKEEREVGLTADMLAWLKQQDQTTKYVFSTPSGNPRLNNFPRELTITAKRAGIKQHVHPHLLRHTFGTLLAYSNSSAWEIQELLGHSSLQTTQIYVHYARKYRDQDAVFLSHWLSEQALGRQLFPHTPSDVPTLLFPEDKSTDSCHL